MKRFFALFLILILVCTMLTVPALASQSTSSPEQGNTEVIVLPSSPQTGGLNIGWIIAAAVVLCVVAVTAIVKLKKAQA